MAGEHQRGRPVNVLQRNAPSLRGLVGVGRTDNRHVDHRTQRSQLLHRLVGRAIFADTDTIVGEDVDHLQPTERGQAHAGAHVVAEDKEGGTKGQHATVIGHAIDDAAHAMFAHTKIDVAPSKAIRGHVTPTFNCVLVAGRQISAAADQIMNDLGQGIDHGATSIARCHRFTNRKDGQCILPAGR